MEEIDLKEMLKEFWDRKIFLVSFILLSFFIVAIFSIFDGKKISTFTANTTILMTKNDMEEEKIGIEQEINSVMALIKSDVMLNEIKNKIDIEIQKENIVVTSEVGNIIQISVINENKEIALQISNVIIDKLTEKPFDTFERKNINIEVINFPENSCELNKMEDKNILTLVILIIIPFGIVFVIYIFDTRIKSKDKIKKEFSIELIEELRMMKKENNSIENELTTIFDFNSENSKLFKIIVTKILNKININEPNVLMITSPNSGEGKTYVASNIGTVLAMFGKKVIILDTNFENNKLDKIFKVPNTLGLSNYLTGINGKGQEIKETLNNFIQETDIKNLNIITAGDVKENITNCLVSERFEEFVKQLKFYYDFIIIDSDKFLNTPNSLILTNKSNNTIVVVNKNSTKVEELEKVKDDIKEVNGNLLGIIINEITKKNIIKEKIENKNEKNYKKKEKR